MKDLLHAKWSILSLILVLWLAACSPSDEANYLGFVEAEWVYVSAIEAGRLIDSPPAAGTYIELNDPLIVLNSELQQANLAQASARRLQAEAQANDLELGQRPEEIRVLEARLEEARARLVRAKSEYERVKPLVADGVEAAIRGDQLEADYLSAKAVVEAAQEQLKLARLGARTEVQKAAVAAVSAAEAAEKAAQWQLAERTVEAEVAGIVQAVFHFAGETVRAGDPVLALLPNNATKVKFYVPQADISQFSVGQTVSVQADGIEQLITGTISFIGQQAEFTPPVIYSADSREKLVFLVEARVPDHTNLRPGLPIEILKP